MLATTAAMLAAAAALALVAAAPALAQARLPLDGVTLEAPPAPPAPSAPSPEPLWVPDPEPPATDEPALADVPAAQVLAQAQAAAAAMPAADDPAAIAIAHWMAAGASAAGIPAELPVMAALVESGLRNLPYGDRDSVGYFQMRLSVWNHGRYEGYLARPELQLRWFVDRALAVQAARVAAGDAGYGADPATWGEWIADVEQPAAHYRGRYGQRLAQAQALLAAPAAVLAPFELGLAVGGPTLDGAPADELAQRVLGDDRITLDARARGDLEAGRVDPRLSAVLLEAAARAPIAVTVLQTGHSYLTVNGTPSNHSFGRGADIGAVGGARVDRDNAAARELALALGALPAQRRPTEIGTPWEISDPAYFTDGDHLDHLHIGFDDALGAGVAADTATGPGEVPVIVPAATRPRRAVRAPAEPRFAAAGGDRGRGGDGAEPAFEVTR
jgi:hypothetical protein